MTPRPFLLAMAVALAALPLSARSLHWSSFDVTARLDADGRLHVVERQAMVFDGDWNGGERIFRLAPAQDLELHRVGRIDPSGSRIDLIRGDLDRVDHYDWADGKTLRWRSRRPQDPPFDQQEIVYEIEYTLANILVPDGSNWVLDHDFAFPQREGAIERFTLDLALDPVWDPLDPVETRYSAARLIPAESFVLTIPLRYTGSAAPASVYAGTPALFRFAGLLLLLAGAAFAGARYYRTEKTTGRFDPLTDPASIDQTWLDEHLFRFRPEIAGAAWDDSTAEAEVSAVIARMVGEKKLRSWTEESGWGPFKTPELHLELLVPRETLEGYELGLVNAFFEKDETRTSTGRIRERYKKKGFNPTSKIRRVEQTAKKLGIRPGSPRGASPDVPWRVLLGLYLAAVLLLVSAGWINGANILPAAVSGGIALAAFGCAAIGATAFRSRVTGFGPTAFAVLLFLTLIIAVPLIVLIFIQVIGLGVALGLPLLSLALVISALEIAHTRDPLERIALRKDLASARAWFIRELDRPDPRLRDEWFPYLLAFGLAPAVNRWFRAFGGTVPAVIPATSHSSSGGGGSSWTGGGGAFGGAGASASWTTAVSGLASGVPAPSSSGSGGGGGGGGSSGGGGGGGW
ncbi:MAG TPA: DUF2207 domain-containing protein [Thermoanaerobaculia bacterium]|nr:DUF2207 domain-containing protein [Thermoanaerobaculia bacterium]